MLDASVSAANLEVLTRSVIDEQEVELLPARNCLLAGSPCGGFAELGKFIGSFTPVGGTVGYGIGCATDYDVQHGLFPPPDVRRFLAPFTT